MQVSLVPFQIERRPYLERLLQFYLYEIGLNPDEDGYIDWGEPMDPYFAKPDHLALELCHGDKPVGFILAKLQRHPTGPDGKTPLEANILEEFYVLRDHRGQGIGRSGAVALISENPRTWVITTWPDLARVRFWRRAFANTPGIACREYEAGEHHGFKGQFVWEVAVER